MAGLTLYVDTTFSSPYAMACYVTLVEKQLPFELKTVNLDAGEQLQPAYRDLSLTGRVPALVHGDMILNESSAIIEYLEEAFPAPQSPSVFPEGIADRARARQIQAWIRSDLMALRTERNTGVIFFAPVDTPLSAEGKQAADRLIRIAGRLIDGATLFGTWSIADTELALMLNRLVANGDPVPEHIAAWVRQQWARPSVQQWLKQPRS
jgi:glutathione S-transferase